MASSVKAWGPAGWRFLHACSFGYPEVPTDDDRGAAYQLVIALKRMLPCSECRQHAAAFIDDSERGITSRDSPHLRSRRAFARWVYAFHESVNVRLGYPSYAFSALEADYGHEQRWCDIRSSCGRKTNPHSVDSAKNLLTLIAGIRSWTPTVLAVAVLMLCVAWAARATFTNKNLHGKRQEIIAVVPAGAFAN